mgnify:FL=1
MAPRILRHWVHSLRYYTELVGYIPVRPIITSGAQNYPTQNMIR